MNTPPDINNQKMLEPIVLVFMKGRYIAGVIAGKVSKTNKIGYVASFPIPEVVRGINAFMLGARSVNPKMSISVVWVNSWYDPGKEGDKQRR